MRLWHLRVERFRGIQHLDWQLSGRVTCLIGAGDQCKTTILDAIGALGTRRTTSFTEQDFFGLNTADGPIEVEAVLGDLPKELLADNRLGMDLCGVDGDGRLHPEPGGQQPAIRIRLDVDGSFEPVWRIFSSRNPDGRVISARDRSALNITRVGDNPDRQFHLGRQSALLNLVGDPADIGRIVEAAYTEARKAVDETDMSSLAPAVEAATELGVRVGAGPAADNLSVGLEMGRTSGAGLSLQGEGVPMRSAGLGTRRLLAVGLELGSATAGALVCLDEVEHGLEPHRIAHLVRTLRTLVEPEAPGDPGGHVLFTTHSPIVLQELGTEGLMVVRTDPDGSAVRDVPESMVGVVRSSPSALLSPRVIVAEGKTEVGVLRAFDVLWRSRHEDRSLAHCGAVVVEGGGASASARARALGELGYPTLLLVDSDVTLQPSVEEHEAVGVEVAMWEGALCTEERLLRDLDWASLVEAFDAVVHQGHEASAVMAAVAADGELEAEATARGLQTARLDPSLDSFRAAGLTETALRGAFGRAAKRKGWFKQIHTGQDLGSIAANAPDIAMTPFGKTMATVEAWCHGG